MSGDEKIWKPFSILPDCSWHIPPLYNSSFGKGNSRLDKKENAVSQTGFSKSSRIQVTARIVSQKNHLYYILAQARIAQELNVQVNSFIVYNILTQARIAQKPPGSIYNKIKLQNQLHFHFYISEWSFVHVHKDV